jgi:uncharacterized protein YegP (UPF0339 family)
MRHYNLFKGANDEIYFNLCNSHNRIILKSEGYKAISGAEKGIESVRKNSTDEEHYDERMSSDDRPYFVLKAGNGEIIGVSPMFDSVSEMHN